MGFVEGKVALVTGAGSGIGRASALLFAEVGAKVVAVDTMVPEGEETVALIRSGGGDATFVQCDVSVPRDAENMVKGAVAMYGTIDCAHNNAGISDDASPAAIYSEAAWDRIVGVNLKGCWLSMKYEIPVMLAAGGGAIVNTSSAAGLVAVAQQTGYVASKFGINGITQSVALEHAKAAIRVNSICPGVIRTPMVERWIGDDPSVAEAVAAGTPMGRIANPREVAELAVWLCSERASFITGAIIAVDGGLTAG